MSKKALTFAVENLKIVLMTKELNINNVLARYNLSEYEVAQALFPHVMYKTFALRRILKGEAYLNTKQLEKLADFIGVTVSELYEENTFTGTFEDGKLAILKGKYKLILVNSHEFEIKYKGNNIYRHTYMDKSNPAKIVDVLKEFETIIHTHNHSKQLKENGAN